MRRIKEIIWEEGFEPVSPMEAERELIAAEELLDIAGHRGQGRVSFVSVLEELEDSEET
jgi:hypothetical protein